MKYIYNISESEESWKKKFSLIHNNMHFSKYLKNSKNHLDFGCGLGTFTYLLAKKYPKTKFYGIDIDERMLTFADETYRLKNLSFDPDNTLKYDSISCLYVLHHTSYPDIELKKLEAKLNEGGRIFILEFKRTTKTKFWKLYTRGYHYQPFEDYYAIHNRWNKQQFEHMCTKAGLKTLLLKDHRKFWFAYVGEKK